MARFINLLLIISIMKLIAQGAEAKLYQDNDIDDTKIITEQDVINSVRELNNYWVTKIKDIKQQLHIAT